MKMPAAAPVIQFEGFAKSFGQIEAVRPLDLSVRRGESFALLGPNGSGKSTLIRAVVGLHTPTAGRIRIEGADIREDRRRTAAGISYMPQRVSMPEHLTAREVVEFYGALRGVEGDGVEAALELVDLAAEADRRVKGFSGGMLQRLGLAVAFLEEVPLYVLDEPTLNLDATGVERMREKLHQLKQRGATILFSSHILQDAVELADRVGIMVAGELVRVQGRSAFRNLLSEESQVRVFLEKPTPEIIAAADRAGARTSAVDGSHFTFRAAASQRLEIIRAIEAAGGHVEAFHTDLPDWDALIGPPVTDDGVES